MRSKSPTGMAREADPPQDGCAIALGAEMLGGRWTLCIVAQLLAGVGTFSALKRNVDGISARVLAERLRRLVALGVVNRGGGSRDPRYALTAWGRGSVRILDAMREWGDGRRRPRG